MQMDPGIHLRIQVAGSARVLSIFSLVRYLCLGYGNCFSNATLGFLIWLCRIVFVHVCFIVFVCEMSPEMVDRQMLVRQAPLHAPLRAHFLCQQPLAAPCTVACTCARHCANSPGVVNQLNGHLMLVEFQLWALAIS